MDNNSIALAVKDMIDSDGWKHLMDEVNERLDMLDREADISAEPNVAISCMKERLGILYVVRTAKELANND